MASVFFNKLSKNNTSESAGTNVNEKEGQTIEEAKLVVDVMNEEGIDVSKNKRKQLNEDAISKYDKIIMITDKNDWPDYIKNNKKVEFWNIGDGKGADYETHVKIRDEIKKRVKELVEKIG